MRKIFSTILFLLFSVFLILPLSAETVVLLHSNDTHGIYKPYKMKLNGGDRLIGGMEATSHYINSLRDNEENVLLIDLGDLMTGTMAAELEYEGVTGGAMIEFLNRMKCDLWCLGNHDFDLGKNNAMSLVRLAKFPTVMANIEYKETGKPFPVKPYQVITIQGTRVGFVGVMEENFLVEVQRESIDGLDVFPVVTTLQSKIPELDKDSDLIVVLYHGRFPEGIEIAKNVTGIDIVLVASDDGRFEVVDEVLVQSTFGHQKTLGYVKVEVENDKVVDYENKQVWLWADEELKPSPEIISLIKEVDEAIGSEYAKVIGKAARDLFRNGKTVENPLGNWMTDAMRWETEAEIGFHNSGGIRDDIRAGPITKNDIFHVSPFRNTLVVFKLTGNQIKKLLEHDVEKDWDRLQVSGLHYKHYPKGAKPLGERIDFVGINGEILVKDGKVLHPDKVYTAVSNNYLVGQAKDKYFGFAVTESENTSALINKVLIAWLEKHKILDYKVEGRIVKIED
jgi:2',3'-cyclic-nucleotide 2'-phosphodiesterase (5'-nucleotidase family)